MDPVKELILNIIREGSNAAEILRGSEILIKESLVLAGAILGGIWGYSLGRTIERNRWRKELGPSLEAMERAIKADVYRLDA